MDFIATKKFILALVLALAIAVLLATAPSIGPALTFVMVMAVFFAGIAVFRTNAPTNESIDNFLESDWRFFERLIELTPEQIAKLQSLTRRPDLKPEALAWIEGQWTLKEGTAEAMLKFFVRSGWASGGNSDHANDPDWKWEI